MWVDTGINPVCSEVQVSISSLIYFLSVPCQSSTYEGLANFNQGQDLFADSWTVVSEGVSNTYNKSYAIGLTTDAITGGSGSLNALVQIPMNISSLDVWNPDFVEFVASAVADGDAEPCENTTRLGEFAAASKPVNKMCEALIENGKFVGWYTGHSLHHDIQLIDRTNIIHRPADQTSYINSISYPYELCHSPDDDAVPYANVINDVAWNVQNVTGDHDGAGLLCIQRAVQFFTSTTYTSVVPQRTGKYCVVSVSKFSSHHDK